MCIYIYIYIHTYIHTTPLRTVKVDPDCVFLPQRLHSMLDGAPKC